MKLPSATLCALVQKVSPSALHSMRPDIVEEQEINLQQWLTQANVLPKDIQGGKINKETLEREWGIKFLGDYDSAFTRVVLPEGWSICPNMVNPYWLRVVDRNGSVRASIFFRAYNGEYRTQMTITPRYSSRSEYANSVEYIFVYDGKTGSIINEIGSRNPLDFKVGIDLYAKSDLWLAEHFPDHQNPFAYWSD